MALDMFLELEGDPPDWDACLEAARKVGVADLEHKDGQLVQGVFSRSGLCFWRSGSSEKGLRPIAAEGHHGCCFLRRYVICFRVGQITTDGSSDDEQDIRQFLIKLSELTSMQFVLSFQFEGVYAVRCRRGFEWHWDMPRESDGAQAGK